MKKAAAIHVDSLEDAFNTRLLDYLNDGINIVDAQGYLIYANNMSCTYAATSREAMLGRHIRDFYPQAALLTVIKTGRSIIDLRVTHIDGRRYMVSAYPFLKGETILGGIAVFKSIDDIESLHEKIRRLQLQVSMQNDEDCLENLVGAETSMKDLISKAKRSVGSLGGPRHCIITGESGTGKTMLAKAIYRYAKRIRVIDEKAPFIEINCGQFTNPDLAAMEIFGSTRGAFTGSVDKTGLFEQADGGILFLDEAHALENYQTMLLKAIESSTIRKIGGDKPIHVDVIIIAASTRKLEEVFLPELYQRLAQNELHLRPLRERSLEEKRALMDRFVSRYIRTVKKTHGVSMTVKWTTDAESLLLSGEFPRNIRQFRDAVNSSIDNASPLISDLDTTSGIPSCIVYVDSIHLPAHVKPAPAVSSVQDPPVSPQARADRIADRGTLPTDLIYRLRDKGLGARRIAKLLNEEGYDLQYYQISYLLKKKPRP